MQVYVTFTDSFIVSSYFMFDLMPAHIEREWLGNHMMFSSNDV